jgi:pyruvate/2-oxoglutarate dehydrogenase complex dihydrolipoamide dehydrogenase (E3) component
MSSSSYVTLPVKPIPVSREVDVVVIGGGASGIGAAISAAANGARTLLIEQRGFLGGMGTVSLLPSVLLRIKKSQLFAALEWT